MLTISGPGAFTPGSSTVTSDMLVDGTIVNADVNSAAGITYSKLSLGTSIVNADISASAAIATSKISGLATSATTDTTNASNISSGTLPGARGITSGSASASFVTYNGTTATTGQFDGGSTNPSATTRLNYGGNFYATNFFGNGSNLTGISAGATITDDTSTNATRYPLFDDVTSGSATTVGVSSTKLTFNPSTGTLNATIFNSLSDINSKENIETIQNALEKVLNIRGVSFTWKESKANSIGVIAQEIETIIPECVQTDERGIKSVNYDSIIGLLIEAIKAQQNEISKLKNDIETVLKRLNKLEGRK